MTGNPGACVRNKSGRTDGIAVTGFAAGSTDLASFCAIVYGTMTVISTVGCTFAEPSGTRCGGASAGSCGPIINLLAAEAVWRTANGKRFEARCCREHPNHLEK